MNTNPEYLFLGGPADGKRIRVPRSLDRFQVAETDLLPPRFDPDTNLADHAFTVHTYRKEMIHRESVTFTVFVHENVTPDHMIGLLIRNYSPHGNHYMDALQRIVRSDFTPGGTLAGHIAQQALDNPPTP